jgi:dUTP pyrophosphatase
MQQPGSNNRPVIQTSKAAGADLYASHDVFLRPFSNEIIGTGYIYDIDATSFIKGRSGLAFNLNVIAFEGVIDADFKGQEVRVKLFNMGAHPYTIYKGDRIAQLVVVSTCTNNYFTTDNTQRTGGFGSTNGNTKETSNA